MILGVIWSFWQFSTFQGFFDYLGDFRGTLVILHVLGDFFCHFRGFVVILIIFVILCILVNL
jgi:hypothetical protein